MMARATWQPSAAGKPIWSLASGYASDRRRRHPLWMLEAYFDDSGTDQDPVFVLAGFLSTAERWAAFKEDWQDVLDDLPTRKRGGPKRLKMSAAMSARARGIENLAYWNVRLSKFQDAIERHAQLGFGCVIHWQPFRELFKNDRIELAPHAYQLAFVGIIAATVSWHAQTNQTDKVDFVFDEQTSHFERANAALLNLWKTDPSLVKVMPGSPRWANDEQVLPLQAAEWLVWQLRKHFELTQDIESDEVDEDLFITGSKGETASAVPICVDIWDRQQLKILRDDIVQSNLTKIDALPDEKIRQTVGGYLRNML